MTRGYLALALVALAGCVPMGEVQRLDADTGATAPLPVWSPGAPNPLPPARSNADMTRDFLELGFAMESGRPIDAFSRFEGPAVSSRSMVERVVFMSACANCFRWWTFTSAPAISWRIWRNPMTRVNNSLP